MFVCMPCLGYSLYRIPKVKIVRRKLDGKERKEGEEGQGKVRRVAGSVSSG